MSLYNVHCVYIYNGADARVDIVALRPAVCLQCNTGDKERGGLNPLLVDALGVEGQANALELLAFQHEVYVWVCRGDRGAG